ncbi:hypothetical protein JCM19233_2900 [Vibrio astriarenae]|nr:hypothetical protein JCM19233_2900 [Vibrio sp. C7]
MIELTSRNLFCKTSYVIDRIIAQTQRTRPVLLTGYWRSGTTWVQDVLAAGINAKTLFEPLEPNTRLPIYQGKVQDVASYVPLSFDVLAKEDLHYLDLAFAGVSPRHQCFNYLSRETLKQAFRHDVVVKLVRGHYLSAELKERYNLSKVMHISRHPMAVTYSMLRTDWEWNMGDVDFSELYARERNMTLSKTQQEILDTLLRFNHQAPECKIAATWALSERFMAQQDHTSPFRYETLLTQPEAEFTRMANELGHHFTMPNNVNSPTVVSAQDRTNIDMSSRLNSWRTKLDPDTQNNIRSVLRELWPEIDQHWEL